ncbi:MAG: arginase family protein [Ignavibacteria bacterium]|nr:arginase family protein [Ignavibacteria bacterium]
MYAHAALSQRTYVSLDMDAFASAYAPGVSAPAADGFTPHEIASCLRTAAASGSLAAFDVVEVNPHFDVDGRTAKLAATMINEVLIGLAQRLRS